jgi:hypothetical protein
MNLKLTDKIVILDFDIPELLNNKIFDPVLANKVSHTILPTCYLYKEAQKQGIQLITPDTFLSLKNKPKKVLLISSLFTPFTKELVSSGAIPTILTCQEAPFIATRFYLGLKRYSSWYKHSFVFKGMKKRLSKKTIYHQMFFPQSFNLNNFRSLPFSEKKFLTMITGNKKLNNGLKKTFKIFIIKFLYGKNVNEIYKERIKIINYFSDQKGFDLYGFGWEKGRKNLKETENIKKVYKGTIENKIEVISKYKFAFCFENCRFRGNVTEKIFDIMFAGTIPIYYGAPDINDYVNPNCFIDFRKFKNYSELNNFLLEIKEADYNEYIKNIKEYLQSDLFKKFTQESFAKEVLEILSKEFKVNA